MIRSNFPTILFFTLLILVEFATAANKWCPVEPDQAAIAKHSLNYKGEIIHFCCSNCIGEFEANPNIYIGQLPLNTQQKLGFSKESTQIQNSGNNGPNSLILSTPYLYGDTSEICFTIAGSIILVCVGLLILLKIRSKRTNKKTLYTCLGFIFAVAPALALIGHYFDIRAKLNEYQHSIDDQLVMDSVHYATYYEFGNPLHVRNDKPSNSLDTTYYRGNDERSTQLFNNGLYRTCTFKLSLTDKGGNPILIGYNITNKDVFLDLDILRAANTPDNFFSKKLISRIYLTSNSSPRYTTDTPLEDKMHLTSSDDSQSFKAHFKLTIQQLLESQKNTIYIREERFNRGSKIGSRVHYAIEVKLDITSGGVIKESSNIWMGATYRTRRLRNWEIPPNEWLSLSPIPELPQPHKGVDDVTLGIEEQEGSTPRMP